MISEISFLYFLLYKNHTINLHFFLLIIFCFWEFYRNCDEIAAYLLGNVFCHAKHVAPKVFVRAVMYFHLA